MPPRPYLNWPHRFSLAHWGLFCFALTWWSDDALNLGLTLLTINAVQQAGLWWPKRRARLSHKLYIASLLLLLGYLLLQAWWLDSQHWVEYLDWVTLLLVPCVGLALHQCRQQLPWFLLLIPIAVLLRMLKSIDWSLLEQSLLSPSPFGFGRHHVPFGLYCAFSLIILMAVSPGLISSLSSRWQRISLTLGISATTAMLLQGLLTSQSRLAWAATIGGSCVFLVLRLQRSTAYLPDRRLLLSGVAGALVLVTALVSVNIDKLKNRLVDQSTIDFELTLDVSKLPRDEDLFIARRLHLSAFGLERWDEKPYMGWGPGHIAPVLALDPDFKKHQHLHNTYVQTLAELGLIGFLLFVTAYTILALSAAHSWRTFGEHVFMSPMVLGVALSYFGWCLFDVRLHNVDGRFVILLLSGLVFSQALDTWRVQATRRR